MYSAHSERKFVVAERFFRTLKGKFHKYKTSISKTVYIDKYSEWIQQYIP